MAVDILERLSSACGYGSIGASPYIDLDQYTCNDLAVYAEGLVVLAFWYNEQQYWKAVMLRQEDGRFVCGKTYEDIAKNMYACFNAGQTLKVVKVDKDIYAQKFSITGIEQASELNAEMPYVQKFMIECVLEGLAE